MMCLSNGLALWVGDHAGDVFDLGDNRGAPGAHQRVTHLVGDLLQRVANNLHGNEIGHGLPRSLTNNPRSAATVAGLSAGISVTYVGSSTIAGPRMIMSGRSRSRSNTSASRYPHFSK